MEGAPRRDAHPNDGIVQTDLVTTGADGSTKILFSDQTILDLGPSSSLKITEYALRQLENRTAVFNLLYGKLRALVNRKVGENGSVEVRTHDAAMGVRGTEFVINVPPTGQDSQTRVMVISGEVRVSPPGGGPSVIVGPGKFIMVTPKTFSQNSSGAAPSRSSAGGTAGSKTAAAAAASPLVSSVSATSTSVAPTDSSPRTPAAVTGAASALPVTTPSAPVAATPVIAPAVSALSVAEVKVEVAAATVHDNTFVNSTTIVPTNGDTSAAPAATMSAAAATLSAIVAAAVTAAPPPPAPTTTSEVISTVIAVPTSLPPVAVPTGGVVRLSVGVQ
ncbi:MAG: FecR domain-containing protein [Deltaproteobacteria bacterium]|nr:FecR domain-containing protein [Deltaproteobacteria bacterium]